MNTTNLLLSKIQDLAVKSQKIDPKKLVGNTIYRGSLKYSVISYNSKKAEIELSDTQTEFSDTIKMSLNEFLQKKIEIVIDK